MSDAQEQLDGLVSCLNERCERFNEDRPITLLVDRVSRSYKDQGGDLAFESTSTSYTHPKDDSDLMCPGCGMPCAVLPGQRPRVPVHMSGVAR